MSPIKRGYVGYLFLAISLLFLVLFAFSRPQAQSNSPKVEGYVYYANGDPMKNVEVRVIYSDQGFVKAETNGQGYYSVAFTKSNHPIRVKYLTQNHIHFPELEELSGSTNHNISRTQQGKVGVYTVPAVVQLNYEAQTAISSSASDEKQKRHYRTLLGDVRIEEGAVSDEVTAALLQSLFNETRQRYGMSSQELKTENGRPLGKTQITFPEFPQPTGACMSSEVLKEMLDRICYQNPPAIEGLNRAAAIDLRRRLDCSGPRLPPNPGDRPNPRGTPNPRIRP